MTYISGSISASSNPAADLYAAMAPALSSAGYVLNDTVIIGSRTHAVWQSPAASNSQGLDWYLDVAYTTTGTGSVWLSPFEDYNASTDIGYRGPYNSNFASIETTYYSRYGATGYALETNWTSVTTSVNAIDASSATFSYWISMTTNRVIGLSSISASKLTYCGFFTPTDAYSTANAALTFPLVCGQLSGTLALTGAVNSVMVTRAPKALGVSWAYVGRFWSHSTYTITPEGGFGVLGDSSQNPYVGAVTPRARKVYMVFCQTSSSSPGTFQSANSSTDAIGGELDGIYAFSAAGSVTRGDTVSVSGNSWVLTSATLNTAYAFRAA